MRYISVILSIMMSWVCGLQAQYISGYPVGFCNGEMAKYASVKYSEKDAVVSAAIRIPAAYASTVAGNRIESVRVGICATKNVESLEVWVRESLDGPAVASGSIDPELIIQGWNEVALALPWQIPESSEGFVIGYSFLQKSKSGAISSIDGMKEGAFFTRCGDDAEWEDRSSEGILSVEGLVYGDRLPMRNVQLLGVKADKVYIQSEGILKGVATVRNIATMNVTDMALTATLPDYGVVRSCRLEAVGMTYGMTEDIPFEIPIGEIEGSVGKEIDVCYSIDSINGGEDEDSSDNSAYGSFKVMEFAFPRTVLLEEFTGENCGNCPRVAGYLHDILAMPEYDGRVATVCHHSGYGTDFLTTQSDIEYEWFYNAGGSTFAPGVMVDKLPINKNSPVYCPSSEEELAQRIYERIQEPAMASAAIEEISVYEDLESGKSICRVKVGCERCHESILAGGDARLTVFITEDNIKARYQSGGGVDYVHQHVNRDVNATWGEPMEWNQNRHETTYEFIINPEWKKGDLSVVAAIGSYTPDDPTACVVENASSARLSSSSVGRLSADRSQLDGCETFSITGQRTYGLTKGVNIIRMPDGSVAKRMAP